MRESSSRRTRILTAAGLSLVVLLVVGWILVRASSRSVDGSPKLDVVAAALTETSTDAPPPPLQRSSRVAEAPEPEPETVTASNFVDPAAWPAPVRMEPGVRLVGNITALQGESVGESATKVEIEGERDSRRARISRGSYVIDDLAPGSYQLRCSSGDLRGETRTITLAPGEIEHREDFVLTPNWSVAIRLVTTDGRNFLDLGEKEKLPTEARLNVIASPDPPPERFSSGDFGRALALSSRYFPRTDADEKIPGDPDGSCSGRLEVHLPTPVHLEVVVHGVVLGSTLLESREKLATIEVPLDRLLGLGCSVRARIVQSEDGSPIARVHAMLFQGGQPIAFEADEEGVARKDNLAPGSCQLMLGAPDRGYEMRRIELLPGIENDLGTIALGQPMYIRGRFVDRAGNSVRANAYAIPYDVARPLEGLESKVFTDTDVDGEGRFELEGLAPRTYVLISTTFLGGGRSEWWSAPVVVDVSHGSVDDLLIEAKPAVSVVLHPVSSEVRGLVFWILSQDGVLCTRGTFRDQSDSKVRLGAGNFRLCVGRDASSAHETTFTVGTEPVTILVEP